MSFVESIQKAQTQTKAVEQILKNGAFVRPLEGSFENADMRKVREEGAVGTITYTMSPTQFQVTYIPCATFPEQRTLIYTDKQIQAVSKEAFQEAQQLMQKNYMSAQEEAKGKALEVCSPKRVALMDRDDFEKTKKGYLNTGLNFLKLINWTPTTNAITNVSNYPYAGCCALTKASRTIQVFIPKPWINYYGYNLVDLKMWLTFLADVGTGFKGHILEETTAEKAFPRQIQAQVPRYANNNMFMTPDMIMHPVIIENTNKNMNNYMNFIMVRYMYNVQYWNIPTVAMQIKKGLGENITSWEALMIAHLNDQYYDYYGLSNNIGVQAARVALPTPNNHPDRVIERVQSSANMNASFEYTNANITEVRKAIREKDYGFIFERLKEWRAKK